MLRAGTLRSRQLLPSGRLFKCVPSLIGSRHTLINQRPAGHASPKTRLRAFGFERSVNGMDWPCSRPVSGSLAKEHTPCLAEATPPSPIGLDPGKYSFHLIGLDSPGAIVLKVARNRGRPARERFAVPDWNRGRRSNATGGRDATRIVAADAPVLFAGPPLAHLSVCSRFERLVRRRSVLKSLFQGWSRSSAG
jgi:hypothetical protein